MGSAGDGGASHLWKGIASIRKPFFIGLVRALFIYVIFGRNTYDNNKPLPTSAY